MKSSAALCSLALIVIYARYGAAFSCARLPADDNCLTPKALVENGCPEEEIVKPVCRACDTCRRQEGEECNEFFHHCRNGLACVEKEDFKFVCEKQSELKIKEADCKVHLTVNRNSFVRLQFYGESSNCTLDINLARKHNIQFPDFDSIPQFSSPYGTPHGISIDGKLFHVSISREENVYNLQKFSLGVTDVKGNSVITMQLEKAPVCTITNLEQTNQTKNKLGKTNNGELYTCLLEDTTYAKSFVAVRAKCNSTDRQSEIMITTDNDYNSDKEKKLECNEEMIVGEGFKITYDSKNARGDDVTFDIKAQDVVGQCTAKTSCLGETDCVELKTRSPCYFDMTTKKQSWNYFERNEITNLRKRQPRIFKDMSAASGCQNEDGVIVYRFGVYKPDRITRLYTAYQKDCVTRNMRMMDNRGKQVDYLLEDIYVYTTNTVHFLKI